MSYMMKIRSRIEDADYGTVFIALDFLDLADYETIKKTLTRLEKEGVIRRVLRGIYDKPQFSKLLKENSAPNPEEVAKAIARKYNWTIAPSGDAALNLLGLSTQVPSDWEFISSGPYKNYDLGKVKIIFLHRADREVTGMSYMTGLVIGALKAIGKENISERDIDVIRSRLTEDEKEKLRTEGRKSSIWIYMTIKTICQETSQKNV